MWTFGHQNWVVEVNQLVVPEVFLWKSNFSLWSTVTDSNCAFFYQCGALDLKGLYSISIL